MEEIGSEDLSSLETRENNNEIRKKNSYLLTKSCLHLSQINRDSEQKNLRAKLIGKDMT